MHPYGWLSLLPPIVAIVLAIATRRVILSLLVGVIVGAVIMAWATIPGPLGEKLLWTLPVAVGRTVETHLWTVATNNERLRVFAFTALMGAMVGIINRSGGMRGLVDALTPLARSRRGGQLVTWALGLLIFFDDYANTLLLGTTLRPLCDRLRISREKLAYLVDSTAAPVAGLAIVSTWVAGELQFIQDGLNKLPLSSNWNSFELFWQSIPYRFYVLWSLVLVALVALLQRDFGPMVRAERDAVSGKGPTGKRDEADADFPAAEDVDAPQSGVIPRWYNAVLPVVVTVGVILVALYLTGRYNVEQQAPTLMDIFGASDSYSSLYWGSLAGVLTAGLLVGAQRLLRFDQIMHAAGRGASLMVPALAILLLASVVSTMTGNSALPGDESTENAGASGVVSTAFPHPEYRLYTGEYLSELLGGNLPPWLLPTVVFLLSSAVSFSTGTSWGTMGIIMPLAVPLAVATMSETTTPAEAASDPVLLCTIGSVLAGSIFGDHCSPISDTTVLSSQASGCDHVAHVWTQMPYALLVATLSVVLGTLPAAFGITSWALLPLGVVLLAATLLVLGKRVEEIPSKPV